MRQKFALFLTVLTLWMHLIPLRLWAESAPSPETVPLELSPEYEIPKKDQEFTQRSEVAEKWVFKKLPRDLGLSMKESFWGWGALGFGLGVGLTAGLYPLDDKVQNSFDKGAIFGDTFNEVIGWTFSPYTYFGVSFITFLVAHNTGHSKLATTTLALTEAIFLSEAVTMTAKLAFRREAPDGGNFSFPSAHSTAAFAAAGVLTTMYGWKAGVPSFAVASLVGLSRIDDDQHFLSDVIMGAVIGTVIGIGTAKFHKKEHPNFFFTGQASHERATVGVTFIY